MLPFIIIILFMLSLFSTTFIVGQSIIERKVIRISIGNSEVEYTIVGNKVVSVKKRAKATHISKEIAPRPKVVAQGSLYEILLEDFEHVGDEVPGPKWDSLDQDSSGGYISWGDVDKNYHFRAYEGNWSVWVAGFLNVSSVSGMIEGDGETDSTYYDIWDNASFSWWLVQVFLENGNTYTFELDWDTNEDLDILILTPSGYRYAEGTTTNKPETVTFTANETGWWYIAVDDYDDNLGVITDFTVYLGETLLVKMVYSPLNIYYEPYMEAYMYANDSFTDASSYDLLGMEFWGWWEIISGDEFGSGFLLNNGSVYLLSFGYNSSSYSPGGTVHGQYLSYRIISKTSDNWLHVGLLADKPFYGSYSITPIFYFYSDSSGVAEGAYVDYVYFYGVDITLDDYYLNVSVAHPGEAVSFWWYVDNPAPLNITNFNLSITFKHVDSGKTRTYFLPVAPGEAYEELEPGSHWFGAYIDGSEVATFDTGYYDVLFEVWSGNVGDSKLWASSGWISKAFQVKHYTEVTFSQSQYSGDYGDSLTITAHIEDTDTKTALSGKTLTLYYYDGSQWVSLGTATSNTNGDAQWTITLTMAPGTYDLMVEFKGDDYYEGDSTTLTNGLVVNAEKTQISFDESSYSVQYGDSITISCVLTDDEGNPLSSKTVDFYYSTDGYTWTYWFSEQTDTSGRASRTLVMTLDPGTYYIKAEFAGDKYYQSSSAQTTLTVNQEATTITLSSDSYSVDYGDSLTLSATLKDDDGNYVDGKTVYFEYYNTSTSKWVSLGSAVTSNGVATITITVTLVPSSYTIRAIFYGDKYYTSSSDTASLTVNKEATSLTDPSTSGKYSDYVLLSTTLTEDGNPLGGYSINFYVDNNLIGSNTTGKDGVAVYRYYISLLPGSYSLKVEFTGNEYYLGSSASGTLTVDKEITVLSDPSTSGTYSDRATIGSTLTDDEGNPIGGKLLVFSIYINQSWKDIGSNTTNKDGYAYVNFVVEWPSGTYSVKVYFAGDSYYSEQTQTGTLTVSKEKTVLSDPSTSGHYSDYALATTSLTDDEKNAIVGVEIIFSVYYGGSWQELGRNETDSNGIAKLRFAIDLPSGVYDLNVTFVGNEYYESTSSVGELTVYKEITELSDPSTSGYYSDDATLITTLTTDDKEPVEGRSIEYYIYNSSTSSWELLGSATTLSNGTAKLTIKLDYTPGTYNIKVSFGGDDYYASSEAQGQLVVYKEKTVLSDPSTSGYYSDYVVVLSKLTDDDSASLEGKNLRFELNINGSWQLLGTNTTNSSGVAMLRVLLDIAPGTYDLNVSFTGDEYYEPCYVLGTLNVEKEVTMITVLSAKVNYSDSTHIIAVLKDDEGNPLSDALVQFYISTDNVSWVAIGSATTNASGYADLYYIANISEGNYTLKAYFGGNKYYGESEGLSKLTVLVEEVALSIDKTSYAVNYSDMLVVNVQLSDNEGNAASGEYVYLNVSTNNGSILLGSALTNDSGYATIYAKIDLAPSTYTIIVYHNRNNYYGYVDTQAQLEVRKEQTLVIDVSGIGRYGDEDAVLRARLVDNENNSISQRTLYFYFYNNTTGTWELLGSNETNDDGYAEIRTALTLPFGEYDLNVTFVGDEYYVASSGLGILRVDREITVLWGVDSVSGKYNTSVKIVLQLTDDDNSTYLANSEIKFVFWDGTQNVSLGSKITNSTGYVELILNLTYLPGNYSLYAIYDGNEYYYGVQKTISVTIEKLILIVSKPSGSGNYSDVAYIDISVVDENGKPYDGLAILEYNDSGKWIAIAQTNVSGGQGNFSVYLDLEPNNYTIRVRIPTSNIYEESTSELGILVVRKEMSLLELSIEGSFEYSDDLAIYVNLTDNEHTPITNRTVTIMLSNGNYSVRTDNNGVAKLSIPIQLAPGNYTLSVIFDGDNYYLGVEASRSIAIEKEKTIIEILANDTVIAGNTVSVGIILKDNDGEPLPNVTVGIYLNESELCNLTTNQNGYAEFEFIAPNTTSTIRIIAKFEGNEYYSGTQNERSISIVLPIVHIMTDSEEYTINYSDYLSISVTVLNYTGDPIPNTIVGLVIVINDTLTWVSNTTTNVKGNANISWLVNIPPGSYTAYIICPELKGYDGSTKTITINVNKEATIIVGATEIYEVEYTDPYTIGAYLRTDDGEAIIGENVSMFIIINNKSIYLGTAVTGQGGYATISIVCDFEPGNYSLLIIYNGSKYYQATQAEYPFVVDLEKLEILDIVIAPERASVGDELKIVVVIGENDENIVYVSGALVALKINNSVVDSGKTDSDGQVELRWVPKKLGMYMLNISATKTYYKPISLTTKRYVFGAPPTIPMYLPVVLVVILGGVLAYLIVKKKRKVRSTEDIG